ncbi:MAG: hypothetical protein ABR506_02455, partial [Candidatus Krumholzibacteriia bacterium]
MLKEFGTAAALIMMLSSFFLAAWLGAVLTRPGRPLHGFVTRRLKPLVLGLFVLHLAIDQWADRGGGALAHGVDQTVLLLLVMLFVP